MSDGPVEAPIAPPEWARLIRDIPDFPSRGILFKDITPLLADARGFAACLDDMAAPWRNTDLDLICGIESRGFIFSAALAPMLGVGFVPLRKAGKLPARTEGVDYGLEYGQARLEVHRDAIAPGRRVLIVDDVLATGGTLEASRQLVERLEAEVVGAVVVLELVALGGRKRWQGGVPLRALVRG
jgi:adenine phosphoribosyltransferase